MACTRLRQGIWTRGRSISAVLLWAGMAAATPPVSTAAPATPSVPTPDATDWLLSLEPGLPQGAECLLPVCVTDSAGWPRRLSAAELRLEVAGLSVEGASLVSLTAAPDGEGSAVALLLDLPPESQGDAAAWGEEVAAFGRASVPGAPRTVLLTGPTLQTLMPLGGRPPSAAEVAAALETTAPGPFWDRVLDALELLAGLEARRAPARRVLIVVATGLEGRRGLHPVQTCLDAAEAARIAVYALALPTERADDPAGVGAGLVWLRQLAVGSGGRLEAAGGAVGASATGTASGLELVAWRRLLAQVEGTVGLRFRLPAGSGARMPASVRVALADVPEAAVSGTLRERALVRARGLGFWPALGLAAVVLGLAGWAVFRLRARTAGELILVQEGSRTVYRLPGGGGSIGSAAQNTVVVDDRRISRHHAVLTSRGGKIVLTDMRSTNGTCVNGRPVQTAILRDGDQILLGGAAELIYRQGPRPKRRGR